ncbi:MAG: hypothetical protein ACE5KI_07775 [Dehalococcoidia bacterium]
MKELEKLITELATTKGILFVVTSEGVAFELDSNPDQAPAFHNGWAEIRGEGWHAHIKLALITGVQFVEQEDHGTVPTLYYTRFSDNRDETVLRAYFPNPYLNEDEKPTGFQPEKLELFHRFKDRYVGQEGITYVTRAREERK